MSDDLLTIAKVQAKDTAAFLAAYGFLAVFFIILGVL